MIVKFYDQVEDEKLKFAVIAARAEGKWVFCKHKARTTFEMPGGHRKPGEPILDTARRELQEETGATAFGPIDSEMEKIVLTADLPTQWTYPQIQPKLLAELEHRGVIQ